jgi:hypothetical protein
MDENYHLTGARRWPLKPTETESMLGHDRLRVMRGLTLRVIRELICVSLVALVLVGFAGHFWASYIALTSKAPTPITTGWRIKIAELCVTSLVSCSLAIAAAVGLRTLRSQQQITRLYPEKQAGIQTDGLETGERTRGSSTAMYDRDIDGVP